MRGELRVCDNHESLSRLAAELFALQAQSACRKKGRCFSVALAGGDTPRRTYELLAANPYRAGVDWSRVHVFWGDERCVPSDDDRNNAKMATEAWLSHVPIPREQIHTIDGSGDPHRSANVYERSLRRFFAGESPRFDFVFLGLGVDGHTASLFPGSAVLHEDRRWVTEVSVAGQQVDRITLTAPLLNQAELVVFLVSGERKAAVLRDVLEGVDTPSLRPAQLIRPQGGRLVWVADARAAHLLSVQS